MNNSEIKQLYHIVVQRNTIEEFRYTVNAEVNNGWFLLGAPIIMKIDGKDCLVQSLYKNKLSPPYH